MLKLIAVILVVFSQFPSEDAFKIKPRIVNGQTAPERKFPYYVFLFVTTDNRPPNQCGGTLLNNEFVLTAAQCLEYVKYVQVNMGTTNFKDTFWSIFSSRHVVYVKKENIFIHPNYVSNPSRIPTSNIGTYSFCSFIKIHK